MNSTLSIKKYEKQRPQRSKPYCKNIPPLCRNYLAKRTKKCVFYAAKTEIQYCETRTNMIKGFQTFAINIHKINN